MLHVLRAQDGRANLFREMEAIFRLDPDSRALEPLLMRELLELERDLLGLDFNPKKQQNRRHRNRPRPEAGQRLVELQGLVIEVVDAGTAARPDLWLLARGTLEMLGGQFYDADITLEQLRRTTDNDSIRDQANIFQEVADVLALDYVDNERERYYYNLLGNRSLTARYPYLTPLVNDKLETVYDQKGQPAKAALLRYGFDAIQKNPQLNYLNELKGMADSLTGNAYDRGLLATRVGEDVRDDLNHLTGIYYLQRGQWEIALDYFRKVPTARRDIYGRFSPFIKQFHDRVNYLPSGNGTTYNRVGLLERLLTLEDDARRTENDTLAARNFFNLGLAHYNFSYFSYNWRFGDAFRSSTSAARAAKSAGTTTSVLSHPNAPLGNLENFSMERARYYFERAAERAPSREAAAEALYYAAKTERNEHYATGRPGGQRPFTYFAQLHERYADTQYHRYVIDECRTFSWFVSRR